MLLKFFRKLKKIEFTLPVILGHHAPITIQDGDSVQDNSSSKKSILDKVTNFFIIKPESSELFQITKRPLFIGIIVIILFFGVLGTWSTFAPIEGAVVANGVVVSLSDRQIIQHLEGGVIQQIMIKENDKVESGQILIRLKNVSSNSQRAILEEKLHNLKATEERLLAERDSRDHITSNQNQNISDVNNNQRLLFNSRKNNIDSQVSILNKRIQQSKQEIKGIKAQLTAGEEQITLVKEELESKRKLLAAGNIDKPHVIALEKQRSALNGRIAEYNTNVARIEQQIGSTKLEIINIRNKFQNDVINELKDIQYSIIDIKKKLLAVDDVINRTEIRAPTSGTVTDLQYHTIGGVIPPGAKIMEIIPIDDDLVIKTKILPKDIDAVLHAQHSEENQVAIDNVNGNRVKVRLLAFNSRTVAVLNGVMLNVSADTIIDNRNPAIQYYLAQVKIPKSELKSISKSEIHLYPGMPAAVFITTEKRTLLSYLLSPIISTMDRAFRER